MKKDSEEDTEQINFHNHGIKNIKTENGASLKEYTEIGVIRLCSKTLNQIVNNKRRQNLLPFTYT